MDDEGRSSGIGGLGMYQIGRWSAETDAQHAATANILHARRQHNQAYDQLIERYNQLANRNNWLRAENQRLSENVVILKNSLAEHNKWADWAQERIAHYKAKANK